MELKPEFVDSLPEKLEEGKLYVSIKFRTAGHMCCCRCGTEVITPIRPDKWTLTYDGESVSLTPSIGNWQLKCRSHYVITRNRIHWEDEWRKEKFSPFPPAETGGGKPEEEKSQELRKEKKPKRKSLLERMKSLFE
jgi:Family of unknown function (DUF6527)